MDERHSKNCLHCAIGCDHPHDETDDLAVGLHISLAEYPCPVVRGSVMRRGGTYTHPDTGLTIGSDEWRRVRCTFCRSEAMTPLEMIAPLTAQDPDGAYSGICSACTFDLRTGHKPGRSRRNHRRRHT